MVPNTSSKHIQTIEEVPLNLWRTQWWSTSGALENTRLIADLFLQFGDPEPRIFDSKSVEESGTRNGATQCC